MIRDLLTLLWNRRQKEPQPLVWTPERVQRFWDGVRVTRLTEFNFSRQAGRALVLAIEHLLPPAGRVLDFGAGDGDLMALLLERGYRVAGYEPSSTRKAALRSRFAGVEGFEGVVDHLDEGQFDVVLMVEVIEHVLDGELDAVLQRLAAVTKSGGTLIVTTPNNEDLALGMSYDPLTNIMFHRWQHVRSFTPATLAALLRRWGFTELVTHQIGIDNALFVPYDPRWGGASPEALLPSHMVELRANRPGCFGTQNNLIYVGTRTP